MPPNHTPTFHLLIIHNLLNLLPNARLADIQIVRPSSILRPRSSFRLAAFNVRTLLQIGQPASLARTLESLAIDVCCLSETRLRGPSTVDKLFAPTTLETTYYLRLSDDMEAAAAGLASVGIVLSNKAEAALLD
ncbi:unnamed protein product [Dicrocoelium dendriticum]|nr:unnamed protein product [Dicrocoelium dendriticum]